MVLNSFPQFFLGDDKMEAEQSSAKRSLQDLPPEVLLKIASFVESSGDLVSFSHVCSATFRAFSQAQSIWSSQLKKTGYLREYPPGPLDEDSDFLSCESKKEFMFQMNTQMRWSKIFELKGYKLTEFYAAPSWDYPQVMHFYDDWAFWVSTETKDVNKIVVFDDNNILFYGEKYFCSACPLHVDGNKTHAVISFKCVACVKLVAVDLKRFHVLWTTRTSHGFQFYVGRNKVYVLDYDEFRVLSLDDGTVVRVVKINFPVRSAGYQISSPVISYRKVEDDLKFIPFWTWHMDLPGFFVYLLDTDTLEISNTGISDLHTLQMYYLASLFVVENLLYICDNFLDVENIFYELPECLPRQFGADSDCEYIMRKVGRTTFPNARHDAIIRVFYPEFQFWTYKGKSFPSTGCDVYSSGKVWISAFCYQGTLNIVLKQNRCEGKTKLIKFRKYRSQSIKAMKVTGCKLLLLLLDQQNVLHFLTLDFELEETSTSNGLRGSLERAFPRWWLFK